MGGAESIELLRTLLESGSTDIMLSFFYVQRRGALPQIIKLLKLYPTVNVFLDSGAKTFLKKDHGDPQVYWKAYYQLLHEHGHRFEYASEFYIDGYSWRDNKGKTHMVSDEQIEVWRDDLHELETVRIVPVWHPERGVAAWDALVKDPRFPHLAIGDAGIIEGGDARISKGGHAGISRGEGGKLVAQAHGWNKTVHGYGEIGSFTNLGVTHFDTIASSTWLVGQKFGDICIFHGGNYSRIYASSRTGKKERKKYRKYFQQIGVDADKIEQDDRQEINKANIIAWNNLSKRLQLNHPHKGPQRPTIAPETTIAPQASPVVLPPENARTTKIIPVQPVESVTVEKTEDTAIVLQEAKPFLPKSAPGLLCDNCVMSMQCPKFSNGAVCAFQEDFSRVTTRNANEVVEELAKIFSVNVERARYLRLWEQINGGVPDGDVTKHMTETFQMGAKLAELQKGKKSVITTASGEGVLSKFFGGIGTPRAQISEKNSEENSPEATLNVEDES